MKQIITLLSLMSIMVMVACNNDNNKPVEVKKEVIVPQSTAPVINAPVEKPTTVVLDTSGVRVKTKKVDVTVQGR